MRLLSLAVGLLLSVGLAVYYWLGATSLLGPHNDDVIYMVLAKSLASGLGYRELEAPGAPWHTGWPPLYPAFLALLWLIFPDFWDFAWSVKALNVVLAVCAVLLTYQLAKHRYEMPLWQAGWASAAVGLGTFHAVMVDFAMSDLLFSTCLLFSLYFLEKAPSWPHRWWSALGIGALMVFPAWARAAGIALTVAALIWLWRRCPPRFWVACGGMAVICYAPWPLYVKLAPYLGPVSWNYGFILRVFGEGIDGVIRALGVFSQSAYRVIFDLSHMTLVPLWTHHWLASRLEGTVIAILLSLSAWGLVAVGLWRMSRHSAPLLVYFLSIYLTLICYYGWDPTRYLLAVSALLLIPFVRGVAWLWDATTVSAIKQRHWQRLAVTLWVGFWFASSLGGGIKVLSMLRKPAHHDALLADWQQAAVRDGVAVAEWLKANSSQDALLMSARPPLSYLLTGRQRVDCCGSVFVSESDRSYLRQHEVYAVVGNTPAPVYENQIFEFIQANLDKCQLKFKAPEGSLRIYRLSGDW